MNDDLYVVGAAWSDVSDDTDLQLDEAVFASCSEALRNAGIRRHQVGFSVTSSLDLYDARSISNALTAPAAAAYLGDEVRVEGDVSNSIMLASATLASGSVDFAIVVAVHVPEIGSVAEQDVAKLREHVSSYTFDSHLDRPVGMTSNVTLGLHAASLLDDGAVDWAEMTERTAGDINRGARRSRPRRGPVSAADVAQSPMAVAPLTQLMLPASSAGVGALILGLGVSARRCPQPLARLTGWGTATSRNSSDPRWLSDPSEAARTARERAYARADITDPASQVGSVEMTDLSPALSPSLLKALDLESLPGDRVNPSGGVRSNYPGIANGMLRVIEATDNLASGIEGAAVVHAADDLCGLVTSTSNVLVLEAP
ncbi:hypothetical protein M1M07_10635 [Rhodococcus sp. HM1]|uniref:hypothetical protein n=1 Tax=Rhodococcus sp. HM1 TaxID=2937759 RepID=UPI00200A91A9|nr:hypothetical protein [Rhodococcus sp. HM1]MCK8671574.1 hypothetical protein [Rhodococcus sp. HM1]